MKVFSWMKEVCCKPWKILDIADSTHILMVLEIGTQKSIKYSRLQIDLILSINKNKEPHKIKLIQCLNSSGDIVADLQLFFMFIPCIFLKFAVLMLIQR